MLDERRKEPVTDVRFSPSGSRLAPPGLAESTPGFLPREKLEEKRALWNETVERANEKERRTERVARETRTEVAGQRERTGVPGRQGEEYELRVLYPSYERRGAGPSRA